MKSMTLSRLAALAAGILFLLLLTPGFASANEGGEDKSIFDLPARWDLSIYTVIVFLLLFVILSRFAWPQILAGMQAREEMLAKAKDEAVKALADAEALRVKLAAEYAQANDKIRLMLEEARRDADTLRTQERETGVKEAAAERDRAKREIEAAKDVALNEIYTKAVDLATNLSSRTLRRQITADDHRRLLDESLAELAAAARTTA